MPMKTALGVGGLMSASGTACTQDMIRVADGGFFDSRELLSENLPRLNIWALQTAPGGVGSGMTVQLYGAIYGGGKGMSDFKLFYTLVLAPNVPAVPFAVGGGFLYPCTKWKLRFTMPAGFGTGTVEYQLCASA